MASSDLSVHLKMQISQKVPGDLEDKLILFQAHFINRQKNLQPHYLASLFANSAPPTLPHPLSSSL